MISHIVCLLIGAFLGMALLGLLVGPRVAELEATVAGLRQLLNPDVTLVSNVRAMDREVEG